MITLFKTIYYYIYFLNYPLSDTKIKNYKKLILYVNSVNRRSKPLKIGGVACSR